MGGGDLRVASYELNRRRFLGQLSVAGAAVGAWPRMSWAGAAGKQLEIGQAEVDITPPLGIELAGFHKPVGKERKIAGVRKPSAARALVLRLGDQMVAFVSLDMIFASRAFVSEVGRQVAEQTGIPAENVHVCCTHTHSMPTFCFLRQWGAIPNQYEKQVGEKIVRAVCQARDDLAAGDFYLGKSRVVGGNFNRTTKTWKTDAEFSAQSTDADRWLDTMLHVLRFERVSKPDVLWYHFSCHPVCYTDDQSGPDWLGLVADHVRATYRGVSPGFLQGHAGDVNPGPGQPWIGLPEPTAKAIIAGFDAALSASQRVPVETLAATTADLSVAFDLDRFQQELETYRTTPEKCAGGVWVDPPFAKDWFDWAKGYDQSRTRHSTPLSAMRLGNVGFVFHSAELYSYYGLAIRRSSPFADTLVVGYADDALGYVTDPNAYKAQEYAAVVVPKIIGLPPFKPETGQSLADEATRLLKKLTV
jgi:hypothetical protein